MMGLRDITMLDGCRIWFSATPKSFAGVKIAVTACPTIIWLMPDILRRQLFMIHR
jgi:hypothetical protein